MEGIEFSFSFCRHIIEAVETLNINKANFRSPGHSYIQADPHPGCRFIFY